MLFIHNKLRYVSIEPSKQMYLNKKRLHHHFQQTKYEIQKLSANLVKNMVLNFLTFKLPHSQFQGRQKLDCQKLHQFQPCGTRVYCFY